MTTRPLTIALSALMLLSLTGPAFALDAYKDRRGFLVRVGVGGVASQACGRECTDRHLGLGLRLRAGVGLNKNTTADFGLHITDSAGEGLAPAQGDSERTIVTLAVGANYYLDSGLYVRGTFGLGQFEETPPSIPTGTLPSVKETGLVYGAEVGFEVFANADWAVAISADLERHSYDDGLNVDLITFGITGTYY